ncbi:ImmA/IrrE family metallo-endopeptidase [Alkalihalobacillus oceani]|uniref:ImmA/IrrE family metallo-endopeptidase n=1 Tax=Halalkalibacter oceani TaxID=1653776 RepID=UPI00203EB66E|nr:ImmA/IrrE family metallo-endopeptidase [Halalkalibacter oceani]MCM3763050.1 ImmA/IrrE family metallo-endopeptidase [Halalkalibacter oceani]
MQNPLTGKERYELEKLVEQKRDMFQLGMGALGDGILQLVAKLDIGMLYLPKEPGTHEEPLSAMYLSSKEKEGNILSFIGVNTAQYYDTQLFAIAHELYHHWEETEDLYLCRNMEEAKGLRERKANQFAASFLLPSKTLKEAILEKNNYELSVDNWNLSALLRFIARLHLDYKTPYKSIVRRLVEVEALTDQALYQTLWSQDVRNETSLYYKIAMSYDADVFTLLNKKTHKMGADARLLEHMLQNYESAIIGLDELAEDLSLFGKQLNEYGLEEELEQGLMEDMLREIEEGEADDED